MIGGCEETIGGVAQKILSRPPENSTAFRRVFWFCIDIRCERSELDSRYSAHHFKDSLR
jgi:hypothetical protein